ncbi:MAG TPA: GDP-mannose 4,6-dehydratase, partial [Candidatus Poseidoniales archaeon]|nr:GDP-mannose 4,6-dehydratase [Candidatus Poseidoniales archaeon]
MTAPEGTPMRRLLVTGGAGFIGSHVADALAMRGDAVIVLDNLDTGTRDNIPDAVTIDPQEVSEISAGM